MVKPLLARGLYRRATMLITARIMRRFFPGWLFPMVAQLRVFMLLFGSIVFAATSQANAESQRYKTAASAVLESPAPKGGLNLAVGNRGLESLSFNGQSFLDSPRTGHLWSKKSVLGRPSPGLLVHRWPPIPRRTQRRTERRRSRQRAAARRGR